MGSAPDVSDESTDEELEGRRSRQVRAALRDPETTLEDLRKTLADPDPAVRRAVLDHRLCPDEWRRDAILNDPNADVRAVGVLSLGRFPEVPDDTYRSPHQQVRKAVAGLADCPLDVLRHLAVRDPAHIVRREALPRLIELDPEAIWEVVYGPHAPGAPLPVDRLLRTRRDASRAAGIPHPGVRAELAERPDASSRLLKLLGLRDASATVRARAVANPGFPVRRLRAVLEDADAGPRAAAVKRHDFPAGLLPCAAADPCPDVRKAALEHRGMPAESVAILASFREPDIEIRKMALNHPNCPIGAIERASMSQYPQVRLAALAQPRALDLEVIWHHLLPVQRLEQPPVEHPTGGVALDIHRFIHDAALHQVRRADWTDISGLPLESLPPQTLITVITENLALAEHDPRPQVRSAAAAHPDADADLLMRLSADPDERVRSAVSRRLLDTTS